MHDYDSTLKLLLRGSAQATMRALTGGRIESWLNVELPKIQNPRVDLLGVAQDQSLVHLELQSSNDANMALRMAEYAFGIYRSYGSFARQILVYVGERSFQMAAELKGPGVSFRYEVIDFRTLDGEGLLRSDEVSDNVIAILARLRDGRAAVRDIVAKLAQLDTSSNERYLRC